METETEDQRLRKYLQRAEVSLYDFRDHLYRPDKPFEKVGVIREMLQLFFGKDTECTRYFRRHRAWEQIQQGARDLVNEVPMPIVRDEAHRAEWQDYHQKRERLKAEYLVKIGELEVKILGKRIEFI
jgi:hypothetical protein